MRSAFYAVLALTALPLTMVPASLGAAGAARLPDQCGHGRCEQADQAELVRAAPATAA